MSGAMMVSTGTFLYKVQGPTPFDFIGPPQLVSASLNGTTQSFLSPSSSTNTNFTQAGDFTVEAWYRPTSVTGSHYLFTLGTEATNRYTWFLNGAVITSNYFGGSNVAYSTSLSINTWNHIAMVRSGTTVTLYVNGTADATTDTQAGTIGNGVLRIAADSSGANRLAGQISNFRVAASAVYTGNFTTPVKPLSATGAVFYMSMGVTPFVDYSTNAITVTNTGTVALADQSPFSTTWTDSVSAIAGTVAVLPNATSTSRPTYDARYGGGINIAQTSQSYLDVPTSYNGAGAFTISMAANIPAAQASHYVGIYDGNTIDRTGAYINSRQWVGDGLEAGGQGVWGASNSTTDPAMGTLAWWDFVYNGRFISVYKNGSLVTGFNNYDMGAGNANTGWLNPLRFAGDESVSSSNTMWPGTLYRAKCQPGALSAGQITTQYNAVRATYGL
jgi:Concanavalin A-like lectin/glucanases superfamily